MHKRFKIPIDHIHIASNSPADVELFNNKYHFKVLTYQKATTRSGYHLLIAAPCSKANVGSFVMMGTPLLCINEYGGWIKETAFEHCPWVSYKSFGFFDNQMGILIDQKLTKVGFSTDSDSTEKRLKQLESIDPSLKTILLGKQTITDFHANHRLYFGYARSTQLVLSFIVAICRLNKDQKKNLIFVIPRSGITRETFEKPQPGSDLDVCPHLISVGFTSIWFCSYPDQKEPSKIDLKQCDDPSDHSSITIISGKFRHQDIKKLICYAEKETLVTGDQSASEAFSANKNWIYEKLYHKTTFADQLNTMWSTFTQKEEKSTQEPPSTTYAMTNSSYAMANSSRTIQGDDHSYVLPLNVTINEIFSNFDLGQRDGYAQMTKFNQELRQFDCTAKLTQEIQQLLAFVQSPIENLTNQEEITSENLHFNVPTLVTTNQVISLQIRDEESKKESFQDSTFKTTLLTPDEWLIIRHSRTIDQKGT